MKSNTEKDRSIIRGPEKQNPLNYNKIDDSFTFEEGGKLEEQNLGNLSNYSGEDSPHSLDGGLENSSMSKIQGPEEQNLSNLLNYQEQEKQNTSNLSNYSGEDSPLYQARDLFEDEYDKQDLRDLLNALGEPPQDDRDKQFIIKFEKEASSSESSSQEFEESKHEINSQENVKPFILQQIINVNNNQQENYQNNNSNFFKPSQKTTWQRIGTFLTVGMLQRCRNIQDYDNIQKKQDWQDDRGEINTFFKK